jgi:lipopolysaccharide export system ATP-binding protein
MKNQLRASNIAKSYRKKEVIKDISLEISSGKVVGLLGPNGAGKTTLFYMISGLVSPDKGSVSIDGTDITALPIHRRARLGIGYLPQEASIFTKLSVEDNIMSILEINPQCHNNDKRLQQLIQEFSLDHIRKSLGFQLSGGERRRVEIARALAADPKFILLDEPFAGVDPISINDTKTVVANLAKKGIGVVITDHNVHETLSICDSVYIIYSGKILASGTPEEVVQVEEVKQAYLGEDFVITR